MSSLARHNDWELASIMTRNGEAGVPTLKRSITQSGFSDSYSFPFASTHSSYEIVSNLCVDGMADPEHSHNHVSKMLCVFVPGDSSGYSTRRTSEPVCPCS